MASACPTCKIGSHRKGQVNPRLALHVPAGTVMGEDSLPGIHRLQAGAEGGAGVGRKVPLRYCLLRVLTISHESSGSGTPLQLLTGHQPHRDRRGGCEWVLGRCGLPRGALSQGHWRLPAPCLQGGTRCTCRPYSPLGVQLLPEPEPPRPHSADVSHDQQFWDRLPHPQPIQSLTRGAPLPKGAIPLFWQVPWGQLLSILFVFCILLTTRYRKRP